MHFMLFAIAAVGSSSLNLPLQIHCFAKLIVVRNKRAGGVNCEVGGAVGSGGIFRQSAQPSQSVSRSIASFPYTRFLPHSVVMIRLFDSLRSFLGDHGEWGTVVNDSLMSRAHSKLTFYGLLAASCLLSASTYYGDAIKCTTMGGYDGGFFETHCILGGTWHMPKYASSEFTNRVITPGIGPKVETIPVRQTCYYYWLPLLVLLSAFSFKAPK